jgi:hypothetical protein
MLYVVLQKLLTELFTIRYNSFAFIGVNLLLSSAFPWPLELSDPNRTLLWRHCVLAAALRCGNGHRRRAQREIWMRAWDLAGLLVRLLHDDVWLTRNWFSSLFCVKETNLISNATGVPICMYVYAALGKSLFGYWSLNSFGCLIYK